MDSPPLDYDFFMGEALNLAKEAAKLREVPIGCVIVYENKIIGSGMNMRNTKKCCLNHAELIAIREASEYMGDWRLEDCVIFVTLEPCPMCAGAIVSSRIKTAVFGARNPKAGSCGSIINLLQVERFNHQVEIVEGVRAGECSALLSEFFKGLRDG